jgi:DNA-binding transcriptional LysR family regulator
MIPDLAQLQVLDSLLRERSLTRTADLLGMSQPTVSRILARLRHHFGDPLFVRAGQRMQPTSRALELAGPVTAVLAAVRQLQGGSAEFDASSADRQFCLYMVDGGVVHVLPRLLRGLEKLAPNVSIHTVQCDPRELEQQMEQGHIDLALGSFPQLLTNIHQRPLWLETYSTIMRRGHPCEHKLDHEAFAAQRHILVAMGDTNHEYAAAGRILDDFLPSTAILCRVPSFTAAAHIVLHTDAIATLPRRLGLALAADLGLIAVETPIALPTLQLAMYWHERCHRDPANRWLRDIVRRLLSEAE